MQNRMQRGIIITVTLILFFSFTTKKVTYQTQCIEIENGGYITLKIWNPTKGVKYKLRHAQRDAVHALLYYGTSSANGCAPQPPLLNSQEEIQNFKIIEKRFFSNNGSWTYYCRGLSIETTLPTAVGTKNWKAFQISISKNELRLYLENEKILKSLNNGF